MPNVHLMLNGYHRLWTAATPVLLPCIEPCYQPRYVRLYWTYLRQRIVTIACYKDTTAYLGPASNAVLGGRATESNY